MADLKREWAEENNINLNGKWLCPMCNEYYTKDGLLCDDCADYKGREADRTDHLNRCEW